MARFIAVQHNWHVHSKGFRVHQLKAKSEDDAYIESTVIKCEGNLEFSSCDVVVIEIDDTESIVNRKLTLKERITGRIN